jgi:hypothetical protein
MKLMVFSVKTFFEVLCPKGLIFITAGERSAFQAVVFVCSPYRRQRGFCRRSMTCGYENPAHSGEKQIPSARMPDMPFVSEKDSTSKKDFVIRNLKYPDFHLLLSLHFFLKQEYR